MKLSSDKEKVKADMCPICRRTTGIERVGRVVCSIADLLRHIRRVTILISIILAIFPGGDVPRGLDSGVKPPTIYI